MMRDTVRSRAGVFGRVSVICTALPVAPGLLPCVLHEVRSPRSLRDAGWLVV